jgi:hypothetical protein
VVSIDDDCPVQILGQSMRRMELEFDDDCPVQLLGQSVDVRDKKTLTSKQWISQSLSSCMSQLLWPGRWKVLLSVNSASLLLSHSDSEYPYENR